ncbi:MAG: hypothetical protein ACPLRM_00380 [Anaerolineae bacterium]
MGIALAQYQAWDDTVGRDETVNLDDTTAWDETTGGENLLNYLLNATSTLKTYEGIGVFEGVPLDLPVCLVNSTQISWTASLPTGTSLTCKVAVSSDGGVTWSAWQTVTNGSAIPGLAAGTQLANAHKLKVRFEMATTNYDVRPSVSDLTVRINSRTIFRLMSDGTFKVAKSVVQNAQETF